MGQRRGHEHDARRDHISRAVVRHRDRFGVVPFFESTFASNKSYWLKALAKALEERLGVEVMVETDDSDVVPF